MKNKLTITIFTILTITAILLTITIAKDNKQSKEANYIQNNIQCYQMAEDGDIQITLQNKKEYYFNIYKDIKSFKLLSKDNSIYLYLNNNLQIKLDPQDVNKIDITKSNYADYKQSFIALSSPEVWELANQEAGIKNELQSFIHFTLYNI